MGGPNFGGEVAVYGTLGTPAPGNIPPKREGASSWIDSAGNFWLFGGSNSPFTSFTAGMAGRYDLDDLWKFNPSTKQWAWMGGSNSPTQPGQPGVYGALGVPTAGNIPGARDAATTWTDGKGNFWLFGGEGVDASGVFGVLNDLWEFSPSTNQWTWMGGSNTFGSSCFQYDVSAGAVNCAQSGAYGTLGTPAAGNIPGSRLGASSWTDSKGNLWLFGGWGYDMNFQLRYVFNDLWEFNPTSDEWTWMAGSGTGEGSSCFDNQTLFYLSCGEAGVYGILGIPAAGNNPGARNGANAWIDSSGNFWLFGGQGFDSGGTFSDLNDLWEYNPSTNQWVWMNGLNTVYGYYAKLTGVEGTLGVPAAANVPFTRWGAVSWTDSKGNFWLYGGQKTGWYGNSVALAYMDDLWEFNPPTNEWAWMGGPITGNATYGALGTPAPANIPGERYGASGWADSSGNFWLFGGQLSPFDPQMRSVYGNDLWEYQPLAPVSIPAAAMPTFSPAGGTYSSAPMVSISDATSGATIYYTTDGETSPTSSSTLYTGPFTVSSGETVQAIAIASGYNNSAVTSVTYTIPPDFSLTATPASLSMNAGQSGLSTISVTPLNGFNSIISLDCSGLPFGASCSFSPETATPSGELVSTVTITTFKTTAALRGNTNWLFPGSVLTAAVCFFGWKRPRRLRMVLVAASVTGLSLLNGCGGQASSTTSTPVSSTVTVTAVAGSLQHATTIFLTLN